MSPAQANLLRALYLHAMAPSTANQDAVRAAGAALDTETARALNAPRSPDPLAAFVAAQEPLGREFDQVLHANLSDLYVRSDAPAPVDSVVAEVRADLLARSERGGAKYGVTLDRRDLGHAQWLQHGYEEALDLACYLKRALREMQPATLRRPGRDDEADAIDAGIEAAEAATPDLLWGKSELLIAKVAATEAVQGLWERMTDAPRNTPATAPVEPPHAAAPVLATLTPEPTEAVLGRAREALAGSLPVYVLAGTGRHPYGDDAWHMETDGVARLFPSKEAAQRWLVAMGRTVAVSAPDSLGYWDCDCGRECRVKDGPDRLPNCRAVWTATP